MPTPTESAVVAKLTRRLIPFLFLLYIVAYIDRINVGFAKLQMSTQLHFNEQVYGLAAGIFFAGYFFFQIPSNLILKRVGARRWIALLMVVWGAISASMMLVTTARSFYAFRFALGVAEAGFFPGVILYLRSWFPAAARARTIALFMTAAALAGVIGGPISGYVLSMEHTGNLAGWQWLFLLEGLPAILLGAVVYFRLPDNPADATWLNAEDRAWLLQSLQQENETHSAADLSTPQGAPQQRRWWDAFLNPTVLLLSVIYFGLNTSSYGISLWLPSMVKGISSAGNFKVGIISALPYIVAAIGMVIVGRHSDRTGERRWHVATPALAGAFAFLAAAYSTSTLVVVAALCVAVLGTFAMLGPFWAIPTSMLNAATASAGIAFINSIGNLGGFAGPYILGLTRNSSGNFKSGLLVLAAAMMLCAGLAILIRIPRAELHPYLE